MKNSGIEWIGEIPYSWQIKSVKNEFTRKQSQSSNLENNILTLARSGVKVRDISTGEGQIASDYSNYNYVTPGDLLLNPMDLVSGDNCNISNFYGVISPAYFNLGVKNHANPYFFNYYFKIQYWIGSFFAHGKGVSFENRWTLNYETLRNFPILFPPLNEQQKIVKILDDNLSYINSLTEQTYQSINELKKYKQLLITEAVTKGFDSTVEMKDSGIEWIGMIPKHWTIKKVKYFLSESSVKNYPNEMVLSLYRDYGVIPKDSRTDNHNVTSSDTSSYKLIEKNDVVINKMKAWQGSLGVSSFKGIISPAYYVYKIIDSDIYSNFLHYALRNNLYLDEYRRISSGIRIGQWDLEKKEFEKLLYPFPNSTSEQQQIVQYLDNKTSAIDNIIADKTKIIEELENYKKSLIYEYVTGKKEV
ncbi:restriction endonuclease subunit S [Staphylococcus hominis]|uniref:restriction endonuclease subunit S n=1 Tax=Staphylococcus hominis TaxID=1290 RepID=UPI001E431938|nr:restriction endonuclease subunit S [Staphylococcus hominis]MCD8764837.1 restriction endonuclease subunit S [Staphylococcus hominis]